jgi:hypothetical protein
MHLIIYGKEVKIKHYDYMLYTHLKQRIIILPKIQAESGVYNFFIKNCTVNGLSFSVLDWWVGNSTIRASNVDYCC